MNNEQEPTHIKLHVNGQEHSTDLKMYASLLTYLRGELKLTGTKLGCATGNCGACSVLIDNQVVQSCQLSLAATEGCDVNTVESIVQTPLGNQIANTLIQYDAAQCGYCLPGIVIAAYAELLNAGNPNPVRALDRNLCRCGSHSRILMALQEVINTQDNSS